MAPDWYGRSYHVAVIWLGVSKLLSARAHRRHYPSQCPLEPNDYTPSCSNLPVMFLDSPDKTLSLGRFESDSPDNILSLGCLINFSTDKSSCTGPKVPDSPDIVLSSEEQSDLGSYSSFASVKCTFLEKLHFDLTLTPDFFSDLDRGRFPTFYERSPQQDILRH